MHASLILGLCAMTAYATPQSTSNNSSKPIPQRPACPPHPASSAEQLANFNAFCYQFLIQKDPTTAFTNYVWADYIQHDSLASQGRDSAIAFLKGVIPSENITVVHQGFAAGFGYVHRYDIQNGISLKIVDVFRMDGSCIVEHWEVLLNLTATGLSQFGKAVCKGPEGNCYTPNRVG